VTAADGVVAQLVFQVQALRLHFVARAAQRHRAGDLLAAGVVKTRIAVGRRCRHLRQGRIVAGRLVDVFRLHLAVQGVDGQVFGDVADVAQAVEFAAIVLGRTEFLVVRGVDGRTDGAGRF